MPLFAPRAFAAGAEAIALMQKTMKQLLLLLAVAGPALHANAQPPKTYQYINGQWFNGKAFKKRTVIVRGGYFATGGQPDSVIDLAGNYVIPPFGEAHTHLLEGIPGINDAISNYLRQGVFYVKNPNNVLEWTKNISGRINRPESIDGSFANAGITSTGGHPQVLYEEVVIQHLKAAMPDIEKSWFRNRAFFNADNAAMLDEVWPIIKAGKPDFIKIYLANSEDDGKQPNPNHRLRKGLTPGMAALIVRRAHAEGYRVSAHVETAADFRQALAANADEINHTPGFYIFEAGAANRYKLTEADARQAARQNVIVVTTFHSSNLIEDTTLLPLSRKIQGDNLRLLHRHGVRIAIGSDHADTPAREIETIMQLRLFDQLTLLKMWTENTAAAIFPARKIGQLKPGYEASFLVLKNHPVAELKPFNDILLRVKQGKILR